MKKYDAIIIGFGKGGKTLAGDLAGQGKRVALIEKSRNMYGGTCINVGCIPTKSLVHSAELAEAFHFDSFEKKAEFYRASMEEKQRLVEMLRQKNYDKVNASENADIYTANKFLSILDPRRSFRRFQVLLRQSGRTPVRLCWT